jgi:multicomponent Na+:H+ antiporter subunit F
MTVYVVFFCFFLLGATAALALVRLLRGPSIVDRIIGFDLVATTVGGMIVLLSVWWRTHLFIEIMLIFSLLGFVGTVAFVSYLHNNPGKFRATRRTKNPSEPTDP